MSGGGSCRVGMVVVILQIVRSTQVKIYWILVCDNYKMYMFTVQIPSISLPHLVQTGMGQVPEEKERDARLEDSPA